MPRSRQVRANTPKRVQWTKQPGVFGAALQFSQGRCAARRENWLSAREHRPGYDAKLQTAYLPADFTRRKTSESKQTLAPRFWGEGFVFEQVLGLETHGGEPAGLGGSAMGGGWDSMIKSERPAQKIRTTATPIKPKNRLPASLSARRIPVFLFVSDACLRARKWQKKDGPAPSHISIGQITAVKIPANTSDRLLTASAVWLISAALEVPTTWAEVPNATPWAAGP